MTWGKQAAHSLAETLGSWFTADGVAAAAAAIDASGTVIAASPPDLPADGRFEIGSVTKTMTATVLAALAADGVLGLGDPIGRWLSAGPHGEITIRQLATHTSGLPAVAPNRQAAQDNPANPWAGYTFERAEEGLPLATVTQGNRWRYSNLGYQLLGLILQRASGTDYPALITERLLDPLAMTHSGVGRRGAGALLPGHAGDRQVPRWEHPLGAGGVEATIADLARYARAGLFPPSTPLGMAIRLAQAPVLPREDGSRQALAWIVEDGETCWHTGGTGGFSSCVMIDHGRGRAVAALLSYGGSPATPPGSSKRRNSSWPAQIPARPPSQSRGRHGAKTPRTPSAPCSPATSPGCTPASSSSAGKKSASSNSNAPGTRPCRTPPRRQASRSCTTRSPPPVPSSPTSPSPPRTTPAACGW